MNLEEILLSRKVRLQKKFELFRLDVLVKQYKIIILPWQSEPMFPVAKHFATHHEIREDVNRYDKSPITSGVRKTSETIDEVIHQSFSMFPNHFVSDIKSTLYPKARTCIPIIDLSDSKIKFWEMSQIRYKELSDTFSDNVVYNSVSNLVTPLYLTYEREKYLPFPKVRSVVARKSMSLGSLMNPNFPTFKEVYHNRIIAQSKLKERLLDLVEDQFDKYETEKQ